MARQLVRVLLSPVNRRNVRAHFQAPAQVLPPGRRHEAAALRARQRDCWRLAVGTYVASPRASLLPPTKVLRWALSQAAPVWAWGRSLAPLGVRAKLPSLAPCQRAQALRKHLRRRQPSRRAESPQVPAVPVSEQRKGQRAAPRRIRRARGGSASPGSAEIRVASTDERPALKRSARRCQATMLPSLRRSSLKRTARYPAHRGRARFEGRSRMRPRQEPESTMPRQSRCSTLVGLPGNRRAKC